MQRDRDYREGARRVAPLALAVLPFGASFGVLARAADVPPLAALVMSATTFAGSGQFAAVAILAAGGGALAAGATALLLNGRYVPIGISVAPEFRGGLLKRLLHSQLVVDESWAIGQVEPGRYDRTLVVGAGAVLYAAWVVGTAVGVLGAGGLGDPEELGLDAAFPALFLALLVSQIRDRGMAVAAVVGAAVALALVPVAPPGVPIIAAALVCLAGVRR